MRRSSLVVVLVASLIFLPSCSDEGAEVLSSIENSSWDLQRVETSGSPTIVIPSSENYTLEFRTSTEVGGVSHCNTYQGSYTLVSPDAISIRSIVSTEIACRPPTHDGEFQQMLAQVKSLKIQGNELQLSNSDHTQMLYFVRSK